MTSGTNPLVHSWAGWIPTVSGQLSFSIIGHSSAAKKCAFVNAAAEADDTKTPVRHVILHQERMTPDFPYFDFITRWRYSGSTCNFICIAQTEEAEIQIMLPRGADGEPRVKAVHNAQGVLKGQVYVLLEDTDTDLHKENTAFIGRLITRIRLSNAGTIKAMSPEINATLVGRDLPAEFPHHPNFVVADFELYRTGEFRLVIEQARLLPLFGDDLDNPETKTKLDRLLKIFPNQIFYFMKDVVHRHYHHDGSSDQMLALTKLTDNHIRGEIDWRRRTLWGLVRVIMQYRREGRWGHLQKAKGVTAYAEAFQHSFANCIRMPFGPQRFRPTSELGTYDFKHMRDSIEVSIAENTNGRSTVWQSVLLMLTFLLAISAAISSFYAKMLSLRLAACSPVKDSIFWTGISAQVGCDDAASTAITSWEWLATNYTVGLIAGLLMLTMVFATRFLADAPVIPSRIWRRLHSIRSTIELFIYAAHAQMVLNFGSAKPFALWAALQAPPALLVGALVVEFWVLFGLLRLLLG